MTQLNLSRLLGTIREQYSLEWYGLHGVSHWARVYENGLRVASGTDTNLEVLLLFSVFHDSRRVNDGIDRGHGSRGAELAAELRGKYLELSEPEFDRLFYACEAHTRGFTEADLTVQVCWDADRLDLSRVPGFKPDPKKLCTATAKDLDLITWASIRAKSEHRPQLLLQEWGQVE